MFWPYWGFQTEEELSVLTKILTGQNSKKTHFPKDGHFIVSARNVHCEVM